MANYLIHHGVKGQQWGVQNGPPYPLSREFTAAERKALYKKAKRAKRKGYSEQTRIIRSLIKVPEQLSADLEKIEDASSILMDRKKAVDKVYSDNAIEYSNEITDKLLKTYSNKNSYSMNDVEKSATEYVLNKTKEVRKNNGLNDSDIREATNLYWKCLSELKDYTNDVVGEYGDKKISAVRSEDYRYAVESALGKSSKSSIASFGRLLYTYEDGGLNDHYDIENFIIANSLDDFEEAINKHH